MPAVANDKVIQGKILKDLSAQGKLMNDLKDMFLADEKYSSEEKGIFMGLRRILTWIADLLFYLFMMR